MLTHSIWFTAGCQLATGNGSNLSSQRHLSRPNLSLSGKPLPTASSILQGWARGEPSSKSCASGPPALSPTHSLGAGSPEGLLFSVVLQSPASSRPTAQPCYPATCPRGAFRQLGQEEEFGVPKSQITCFSRGSGHKRAKHECQTIMEMKDVFWIVFHCANENLAWLSYFR